MKTTNQTDSKAAFELTPTTGICLTPAGHAMQLFEVLAAITPEGEMWFARRDVNDVISDLSYLIVY